MCFYKDTQAAISKKTLHNFLFNKATNAAQKTDRVEKTVTASFQVKQEEEELKEMPHKKLQISNDLFKDLLKLSGGEMNLGNNTNNYDSTASEDTTSPLRESPYSMQKNEMEIQKNCVQISPVQQNNFAEIIMMIENTNTMLQGFMDSQRALESQIRILAQETREHQSQDMEESPFERLNRITLKEKQAVKATTNPTYSSMLSLFTQGRTSFPYALKLSVSLPSPILREKNIRIAVQLVRTSDGSLVENHGDMLLQISIHTWELPSSTILRNKTGNKVLQGEDECELKNGQGSFDKLQIDEVTSKFINGCIGVLIVAKRPVNFGTSLESLQQKSLFKIQDIQPLLIEKVIVKSKKKNSAKA